MKQEQEKIYHNKKKTIQELNKVKYQYLLTIYAGIVKGKSAKQIHKDLINDSLLNKKLGIAGDKYLLLDAKRIAKKVVKEAEDNKAMGLDFIPLAFATLNDGKSIDRMNKIIYEHAREQETKQKETMIKKDLEKARQEKTEVRVIDTTNGGQIDFKNVPKVFYLISKHQDSASDHAPYQGHLYIDTNWKKYITDVRLQAIIQDFVNKNIPMSFQKLIDRPIWMITRPNCRHYYLPISVQEALNENDSTLLNRYKMNRMIGQRGTYQTINHPTNKAWYNKQNVINIIQKYKERLEFHEKAKSICDNLEITKLIKKDKILIKKWTKYLQTL